MYQFCEAHGQEIAGEEDRQFFMSDFNGGDWSGMR